VDKLTVTQPYHQLVGPNGLINAVTGDFCRASVGRQRKLLALPVVAAQKGYPEG